MERWRARESPGRWVSEEPRVYRLQFLVGRDGGPRRRLGGSEKHEESGERTNRLKTAGER